MINIDLKEYDYPLPESKIAQYPLEKRDSSRLLLYRNNSISEDIFRNIDLHLPHKSLLVFNNTKVIRARLIFSKASGATIEILCLEPIVPSDYSLSFSNIRSVEWKCLIGNVRKWKKGPIELSFKKNNRNCRLFAEKLTQVKDSWRVKFSWDPPELSFIEVVESAGHIPLPPYISRPDEPEDSERYQTLYSLINGSVAAPTAGLHFTKEVFSKLLLNKTEMVHLTLHVGAGTFLPVKSGNIADHLMHSEHFSATAKVVESLLKNAGHVIAVGTTSVRSLESLFWLGLKIIKRPSISPEELFVDQWKAYINENNLDSYRSLESILHWMGRNKLDSIQAPTRIIIIPGYKFRVINGMITNFHQPKSTLLLLISAWVGDDWKKIYSYALENDFRFLSYGDSSLLL